MYCGPFTTEAKYLQDVKVGRAWNFAPLQDDDNTPCPDKVKYVLERVLIRLYEKSWVDANNIIKNIIWIDDVPTFYITMLIAMRTRLNMCGFW